MAPTLPRAPRQFNERVGRVALRLLKGFLLVMDFFLELLDARVGGEVFGHRTVVAVDLLDAAAVCVADRRAGGVVSLLGRADDAVELECVVRLRAPGADPAKIGLVGVFTGNAIGCIGKQRGPGGSGEEPGGGCRKIGRIALPIHWRWDSLSPDCPKY